MLSVFRVMNTMPISPPPLPKSNPPLPLRGLTVDGRVKAYPSNYPVLRQGNPTRYP